MRALGLLMSLLLLLVPVARAEEEPPPPELELGGALRFNLIYNTWSEQLRERGGDILFDTARLNADGSWRRLLFSAEYRFYSGFQMLHHGYVGYVFSDRFTLQAGVHRVPFGLLPYASHNWFFMLPYYVGLEDDYDLGLKAVLLLGELDVRLAFYKNDEGSFLGSSLDSARYSYDVVRIREGAIPGVGAVSVEEVNQLNGRIVWPVALGSGEGEAPEGVLELGLSGQVGGLYDRDTEELGTHWAAAAHLNLTWHQLNLQLEGLSYAYAPPGVLADAPFVVFGAYDAPYKVARRAFGLVANVAWGIPTPGWGPLQKITLYNDFSWLAKRPAGFDDSYQNVTGASFLAGPLLTYVDFAAGRNHPFLGPDYAVALAEGGEDAGWELRFNINLGYYF